MSNNYTYSDPTLSLWLAAAAEVQRRRQSVRDRMATATSKRIALSALPAEDSLSSRLIN